MKNYYIVSIAVLAVMMLILFRTLSVTGWFERQSAQQSAESIISQVLGEFEVQIDDSLAGNEARIVSGIQIDVVEPDWLALRLDSSIAFHLKVSDFEDEQILVELFEIDSLGNDQRMDGCELLLSSDGSGKWTGSTLGEFCGYNEDEEIYHSLDLRIDGDICFTVSTRSIEDQILLKETEYLLKRPDHDE